MITHVGKNKKKWVFTRMNLHWQSIKDKSCHLPESSLVSQNRSWYSWSLHPDSQGRAAQISPRVKVGDHTECLNYCLKCNTGLKLHYVFLLFFWLVTCLCFLYISYLRTIISVSFSFSSSLISILTGSLLQG